MRRFILMAILLVVAGLAVGFLVRTRQRHAQPPMSQSGTNVVAIPVEGMVCASCTARVKKDLESVDGVTKVEVSLQRRETRVRYVDTKVSPKTLVAAINELGYKAGTPAVERER